MLLRKIGEDELIVILAKHVPTKNHPRPHKLPQPVGKEEMQLTVSEVREQITLAFEGLVAVLEDRFPCRDLLYAFEIISLQYWNTDSVPDAFEDSLAWLIQEFGLAKETAEGTVVSALIDADRLHEQKERFQSLALYFSPRVCDENQAPSSVKSGAVLMWQAMSKSPLSDEQTGEFFRLARFLFTVVSGSVADERVFSALEFVKCPHRTSCRSTSRCATEECGCL